VDRALSDPRYGERWARHWLDLARYGESDGYEDDKVRPHAWRYRDYVVGSLNADKPYNQFVEEQIAGDELRPEQAEAWIATGFARLGAWDGMSKEPAQQRQDFLNDVTDAIGAAFLGLTLGCARCHDHKYDVITQRDYYRVQSFFAGVKRDIRAMPALDEPAFVTAAFTSESAELQRLKDERAALLHSAREALKSEGPSQDKKVDEAAVAKQVNKEHPGRLTKLNEAIKGLESRTSLHARRVEAVFQGSASRTKTYLLKGGELARPGEEITPGFIAALSAPGGAAESAPSRIAFAHWLTTTNHPLTARVLVNRLWQHHFGAGLVDTPSDFGRNGKRPTHLELLDWLATEFVRTGWSMKKMHRLIMTTEAYRRSSGPRAQSSARDPENRLLWRMNRRRVEGEVIRDTILSVSGTLANTMGGPGVYAPLPQGVNVEFPNNDKWPAERTMFAAASTSSNAAA
jgi:hypothetical protein